MLISNTAQPRVWYYFHTTVPQKYWGLVGRNKRKEVICLHIELFCYLHWQALTVESGAASETHIFLSNSTETPRGAALKLKPAQRFGRHSPRSHAAVSPSHRTKTPARRTTQVSDSQWVLLGWLCETPPAPSPRNPVEFRRGAVFSVKKWLQHLWGGVTQKLQRPAAVILYEERLFSN